MAAVTGFSFNFGAVSAALKETAGSNGVSFEGQGKKWENEEQGKTRCARLKNIKYGRRRDDTNTFPQPKT